MSKSKQLKPEEDAFGQMMWAYYKGKEICEIVERDDGYFSAHKNPKVYFSEYEDWPVIEQKAVKFAKGKVLDIGCGAGRHSLYLQKKGLDVLGIDSSPLAVKICKLRGLKKAKVMSLEDVNFKPKSLDTIIMMGGNFGLFGDPKKAEKLLKNFHIIASDGGLIIAATVDPYKTDNPLHLEYQKRNREKGRMAGQVKIRVRFEKTVTKWFDWLMVSREEMKELVKGTGWIVKQFIDSKEARYIAIIERKT